MSTYLYGITRARTATRKPKQRTSGRDKKGARVELAVAGVGNPGAEVRRVEHQKVAALVSDVVDDYHPEGEGLRGMRRDMRAHAAILNDVARSATVLPFRFGVVFPDDESVRARLLRPHAEELSAYLDALDGAVEVTLRATSVEDEALRAVIAARPELAGATGRSRGGSLAQESRVERGRQLAAAIQDLQESDARWIIDALAPAARDVRIGKPLGELMALNASFLVDRDKLKVFDRQLEQLAAEAGHRIQFDCVGPLAPFSFVDLRL